MRENRLYGLAGGETEINRSSLPRSLAQLPQLALVISLGLDHAAVNAVRCHVVRLVGEPNAFPLLQHQA